MRLQLDFVGVIYVSRWFIFSLARCRPNNDKFDPTFGAIASDRSMAMHMYYMGIKMLMASLEVVIFGVIVLEF